MKKLDDELYSKNKQISQLLETNEEQDKIIKVKDEEIDQLQRELREKSEIAILRNGDDDKILKNEMDESNEDSSCDETLKDLENMLEKSDSSEKRIRELENALRETIRISTEREQVLQDEERKRKDIMQKVFKLEQRLLSLQTAQAMRCHSCNQYVKRMTNIESRLTRLLSERKENLRELNRMKMDALESAISEKDAHLAFLEMSGIRNAKQADEAEKLRLDKRKLMDRLKKENEISMSLCHQGEIAADSDSFNNSDED